MFLGDKKDDIEATDDQFKARDTLEQVFELADTVSNGYVVCGHQQTVPCG